MVSLEKIVLGLRAADEAGAYAAKVDQRGATAKPYDVGVMSVEVK